MYDIKRLLTLVLVGAVALATVWAGGAQESAKGSDGKTVLTLARFFGDCDETTAGVTDVSQATTECEVIQILTNKFNAENEYGITIQRLGGAEWGTYYDALNTSFAGGDPPDIAVMHGSNLPDYASRGLLQSLDGLYDDYGIDPDDWTGPAQDAVSYDGKYYGVAFDLHANLLHINVDLFQEAGLVDAEGRPVMPSSPEEFFKQAAIMKAKTGAWYFAMDASQFPVSVRLLLSLVAQQNSDLVSSDGTRATIDTPQARKALEFMVRMFDEGYANRNFNYTASQNAFLSGDAAILLNGTWAVDQYNREAKFQYQVVDFPTLYNQPAVWANSHLWVLPKKQNTRQEAAMHFLAFLNDHVYDWAAGTGHIAPRKSVLDSKRLRDVAPRANYAHTAEIASMVPAIQNWQAVEDILKEEIEATWLTGVSIDKALSNADSRVNGVLKR